MSLEFSTFKIIIYALLAVFVVTALFGFLAFLPPEKAYAQFGVVLTPVSDAVDWIIDALVKVWDSARYLAGQAWEFAKDLSLDIAKAVRENIRAFLYGLAIKLAVNALQVVMDRIIEQNKITDYISYIDRITRYVYAIQQIDKRLDDGNISEDDGKILKAMVLSGSADVWSSAWSDTKVHQYINEKIAKTDYCRVDNLYPTNPNYYAELMRSKAPECSPVFLSAAAADATLGIIGEAQNAAQVELYSSGGYKSIRDCGYVKTEDVLEGRYSYSEDIFDEEGNMIEQGGITILPSEVVGERSDLSASGYALACSAILTPGSYTFGMVDKMMEVLVTQSSDPKEVSTGTKVANFLSSFFANTLTNLIFCGKSGSILGNLPGNQAGECFDFDFESQIPDIDADDPLRNLPNPSSDGINFAGRDEQNLRNFWNDVCNEKLPLLFAVRNGNYPQYQFPPIAADALRDKGAITTPDRAIAQTYLLPRPQLIGLYDDGTGIKLSVEDMLKEPILPPFIQRDTSGYGNTSSKNSMTYNFVWEIQEADINDPSADDSDFDDEIAIARRYYMAKSGFPTGSDIGEAQNWFPPNWPYFYDSRTGLGFIWPLEYATGEALAKQGYFRWEAADPETLLESEFYRIAKYYTVSGVYDPASQAYDTIRLDEASPVNRVYRTGSGDLLFATRPGNNQEIWKINQNVSVNIEIIDANNVRLLTDYNGLKNQFGAVFSVIEYRDERGNLRTAAATKLERQKPCFQEPFGPPINLSDLQKKIEWSKSFSRRQFLSGEYYYPLWDHIATKFFIQSNRSTGF